MSLGDEDLHWVSKLLDGADVKRRRVPPSSVSLTGKVASTKNMRSQHAESLLEADFLRLLESDHRVERFASQAVCIPWVLPTGRRSHYTPDVIVKYTDAELTKNPWRRHTVFEVKPAGVIQAQWKELKPKWIAARRWCRSFGLAFRVVTEARIRGPELANITFLKRFRLEDLTDDPQSMAATLEHMRSLLAGMRQGTPRRLLERWTKDPDERSRMLPWVWHLIGTGQIRTNLNEPLTMASTIWIEHGRTR